MCFYCGRRATLALWEFAGYLHSCDVPVCESCAHALLELIDVEGSYVRGGFGAWIAVPPPLGGRRRVYGNEWPPYRDAMAGHDARVLTQTTP